MTSDGLIRRPDDLPADWLTSVPPGGHVASFSVQPIGTGQMSDGFRDSLTSADGDTLGPESVVLKVASSDPTSRSTGVGLLSGEVGLCMPDPEIFALAVTRLGLLAPQCVFVDEFEVNLAAAERAGLRAVLHPRTEHTTRRIAELFG